MGRYTIDFDDDFDKLLTELSNQKGGTKADVIRRAVSSYGYLTRETANDANKKVSITSSKDQVLKDVVLP